MRVSFYLGQGWIFLLVGILCTIGCSTPSAAPAPHVLRDVRVVHQDGHWHVVLTGSESMTYKDMKTSQPLRVVVDLPNTVSKTIITSSVKDNGIIGTVKARTVVQDPQPLTRVDIGLNQDISYKISRLDEEIWVSFDTSQVLTDTVPTQVEPVSDLKGADYPLEAKAPKEFSSPKHMLEKPMTSDRHISNERLPFANKILAIEPVALDKDLDIHIIGDGRLDNYEVFVLSNPPRLVVDLMKVHATEVKDALSLGGPWVKKIRVGLHTDRVRVVFELTHIHEGEVPYEIISEKNRLVISFLPSSDSPSP